MVVMVIWMAARALLGVLYRCARVFWNVTRVFLGGCHSVLDDWWLSLCLGCY